jgi:hypothetical protein
MLHQFLIVAFLVTVPLQGSGVKTVTAFGNMFGGFGHHPQMYHAHPFSQDYFPNRHHMFRQQELARQRRAQEERRQREAEYERYQQQQQRQAEYDRYRRQEELQRRHQEYEQIGQQDEYTRRYATQQPYYQMQQERERDQYRRGLLQQQSQYQDELAEHEKIQAQYQMKLAAAKKKASEERDAKLELERKLNLGRELELRAEKLEQQSEQSNSTSILETVKMSTDSDSTPPGTRILDDTGEIIYDVNLPFVQNAGVMENSEEPVEVVIDAVDLMFAIHSH